LRRVLSLAVPLLWLGVAAAQDTGGDPAPAPDPARALLDALTAKFKDAKALDVVTETEQVVNPGGDDEQSMKASGEAHLAKPLYGSFRVRAKEGDEELDIEVVGTGEKLVVINHIDKTAQPGPGAWQDFFSLYLMRTWAVGAPAVTRVALEETDGGRRLTIAWGGRTEKLLVDKDDRVRSAEVVEVQGDATKVTKHAFARFEASDADPKTYARTVPEGYEENDPMAEMNASLVNVGAVAPDVTVTGMDDKAMKLADLKGKTVLLNFWFFH